MAAGPRSDRAHVLWDSRRPLSPTGTIAYAEVTDGMLDFPMKYIRALGWNSARCDLPTGDCAGTSRPAHAQPWAATLRPLAEVLVGLGCSCL